MESNIVEGNSAKAGFKVIIAGSRNFEHYRLLKFKCDSILKELKARYEIQVVSGTAKGADQLGERYARENHYICKRFEPDWDRDGKSAGFLRNEEMAKYSDYLIAFWDGKSSGTKHMIETAKKHNLKIRVIKFA